MKEVSERKRNYNNRQALIVSIKSAQELLRRQARSIFSSFVLYLKRDYEMQWFHRYICDRLDVFERGEVKKLMVLMPPQHGKTELATRLFSAYLLGRNPNRKIAITSYGDSIASGFNRDIQRYIDSERYNELFPQTKLNNSKIFNTNYANQTRTEHKFDIVGQAGTLKTVGRGGSLTSETVDIGIIDDLYKDREEARSMTVSESAWNWYVDVFRTRFHNDSQQLIMNTRWDENDIAGRLLVEEVGEWEVIKFPAIRTNEVNSYDIRKEGEPLWPDWHSLEKIQGQRKLGEVSFNSLQQQDPKPNTEILVFGKPEWIQIPEWPLTLTSFSWGLDFGKTTGINALIKCSSDITGYYFDECLYEPSVPATHIRDLLIANGYKVGEIVYCDHMLAKINALRLLGVNAVQAIKGAGSISFGIDKLNEMSCHYTSRSVNLRNELNNYQYVCYGKIITNEPVDEFNHALDAARYGTVSRFFRGR